MIWRNNIISLFKMSMLFLMGRRKLVKGSLQEKLAQKKKLGRSWNSFYKWHMSREFWEVDSFTRHINVNDLARGREMGQLPQQKRHSWRWRFIVFPVPVPLLHPEHPGCTRTQPAAPGLCCSQNHTRDRSVLFIICLVSLWATWKLDLLCF